MRTSASLNPNITTEEENERKIILQRMAQELLDDEHEPPYNPEWPSFCSLNKRQDIHFTSQQVVDSSIQLLFALGFCKCSCLSWEV